MPPRGGRGGSGSSHRVGGRGRGGGNRPNSSRFQQAETGNRVARPASVSVGRGGKAAFSAPAWNLCEVPPMPYAAFVGRGSGVNDYLAEARARKDFAHEGRMALAGLDQSAVHVASTADLRVHLEALDGRQFPAYKELTGREFYFDPTGLSPGTQPRLKLRWVTIQGDPFARASAVEIYLIPQRFGWSCSDGIDSYRDESHPLSSKTRKIALCDFLHRRLYENAKNVKILRSKDGADSKGGYHTTPRGGFIEIAPPVPQVLERSAVTIEPCRHSVHQSLLVVRFAISLPAQGRIIDGHGASALVEKALTLVFASFKSKSFPVIEPSAQVHIQSVYDQEWLRGQLRKSDLTAFVPNGAILARKSGDSQEPMDPSLAVPFKSPPELAKTYVLPSGRAQTGMVLGSSKCYSVIGAGFHGKSTLLSALALGCYNHVPGDGREFLVSTRWSHVIRSEEGRAVTNVNVSAFFNSLPGTAEPGHFTTSNASGSTSCAASLIEAAAGWPTGQFFLIDEDSVASNWLQRDSRMAEIVPNETIKPLASQIEGLVRNEMATVLLVAGSSTSFFGVASEVISMDNFVPIRRTEKAKSIAKTMPEIKQDGFAFPNERFIRTESLAEGKIAPREKEIQHGETTVYLGQNPQIVAAAQTRAIAYFLEAIGHPTGWYNTKRMRREIEFDTEELEGEIVVGRIGWDSSDGFLAMPRSQDVLYAMNRIRTLDAVQENFLGMPLSFDPWGHPL